VPSVIVGACRTPIGAFQGALASLAATELGAVALREALRRAGVDGASVDEVIMGNVLSAGLGQAPARQASRGAGLPDAVGAVLVNKVCGSGLKAVMLADQSIRAGDSRIVLAGGMESMSGAPYLLPSVRQGLRLGHGQVVDSVLRDGLWDPFHDHHMGSTGELCAREQGIDRERQDRFAAESYRRALAARESCAFSAEITPVQVSGRRESVTVSLDEVPRETTLENLAPLKPAFDPGGTVTAGNSSKLADGAAAVCVVEESLAAAAGLRPLARIVASATHSREPERLMMAPEEAVRKCLRKAGWESADLYEINEPFAAATTALIEALGLDPDRVNVNGGAVALGHPIGATGCRILVTLLHAMLARQAARGVAALCLGGGEAVAMAVELPG